MFRFLTDENFRLEIARGVQLRVASFDFVRAEDVGLRQTPDPIILEWASQEGRILLTHDRRTMVRDAYAALAASTPMPGVVYIPFVCDVGNVIDDLVFMLEAGREDEFRDEVTTLPFR